MTGLPFFFFPPSCGCHCELEQLQRALLHPDQMLGARWVLRPPCCKSANTKPAPSCKHSVVMAWLHVVPSLWGRLQPTEPSLPWGEALQRSTKSSGTDVSTCSPKVSRWAWIIYTFQTWHICPTIPSNEKMIFTFSTKYMLEWKWSPTLPGYPPPKRKDYLTILIEPLQCVFFHFYLMVHPWMHALTHNISTEETILKSCLLLMKFLKIKGCMSLCNPFHLLWNLNQNSEIFSVYKSKRIK